MLLIILNVWCVFCFVYLSSVIEGKKVYIKGKDMLAFEKGMFRSGQPVHDDDCRIIATIISI
jgi:hypothetical protein